MGEEFEAALPLALTRFGKFPLEVCYSAEGERYREVLQGQEMADFIKFATAPAYERKNQIQHGLKLLSHHKDPTIAAHGLKVGRYMLLGGDISHAASSTLLPELFDPLTRPLLPQRLKPESVS
ncbi:hypothetical protein V492_06626 [Pseudogymnoascus sp. VKM F-4246]|nr:hypothetical protein V492_06626 [Pseudogymnoascus sp. VKM F-4246]